MQNLEASSVSSIRRLRHFSRRVSLHMLTEQVKHAEMKCNFTKVLSGTGAIPPPPPPRAIGYSYTLSLFVPRIAPYLAVPPIQTPVALTCCLHAKQNKGGVSHVKLPSEGHRTIGGYRSYGIATSRYTAPLSQSVLAFLRRAAGRGGGNKG